MAEKILERHYYVRTLDFGDFWDICGHFMRAHPRLPDISYTVKGQHEVIADHETDVAEIIRRVNAAGQRIDWFQGELTDDAAGGWERAIITYRPRAVDGAQEGLSFISPSIPKTTLAEFEEAIIELYDVPEDDDNSVPFGQPCEILAAVLDIRGFSAFCEQPNIESPYICGLMYSFFRMAARGFKRFPADLVKFSGDGLLAVWETTYEDRPLAIEACLEGALSIDHRWQQVRQRPQFSHGAPEKVGVGISFGLGSSIPDVDDYIGRPINIASRLCSACQGGEILVDKAVPNLDPDIRKIESSVHIRSFGRYHVWRLQGE